MIGSHPQPKGFNEPRLADEPLKWGTYLLLRFVQGLYNFMDRGMYRWEPDDKDSEIIVRDQGTIEAEVVGKRPAVLLVRGPCQFSNLFMDQLVSMDMLSGVRVHSDLIAGTFTLQCVAKFGEEAQHIAWLTARGIREQHRLLRKYWSLQDPETGNPYYTFGFHKIGDNISFGSEAAAGSIVTGAGDSEYIVVPIQLPFFLQWTWRTTPQAPAHKETLGLILENARARDVIPPVLEQVNQARVNFAIQGSPLYSSSGARIRQAIIEDHQAADMGDEPASS